MMQIQVLAKISASQHQTLSLEREGTDTLIKISEIMIQLAEFKENVYNRYPKYCTTSYQKLPSEKHY
jgi:hypothetical protein